MSFTANALYIRNDAANQELTLQGDFSVFADAVPTATAVSVTIDVPEPAAEEEEEVTE